MAEKDLEQKIQSNSLVRIAYALEKIIQIINKKTNKLKRRRYVNKK